MSDMKPETDNESTLDEQIYSKIPRLSAEDLNNLLDGFQSDMIKMEYSFEEDSFIDFYIESEEFRKIVDSGKYVYVDGKVVLKSKECLSLQNGELITVNITDETLRDYCVYKSPISIVSVGGGMGRRKPISFCGKPGIGKSRIFVSDAHRGKNDLFKEAQKISSVKDITEDNLFVIFGGGYGNETPPDNFGLALAHFMKERGVTIEGLAELTGVSDRTIRRMKDPKNEIYSLNAVVAVCVALHLTAYQCDMMIMLAGYRLKNTKTDNLYRLFLNFAFKETVLECNNALIRCGLKPLTKLHD